MDYDAEIRILKEIGDAHKKEIEQLKNQNILLKGIIRTFYDIHRVDFIEKYGKPCDCVPCKKAGMILFPPKNPNHCETCG